MIKLKLNPLLYEDTCEKHGKTKFIVDQQCFDFKKKKVEFVFYCKKCWLKLGLDCPAWVTTMTIAEYNEYFGCDMNAGN